MKGETKLDKIAANDEYNMRLFVVTCKVTASSSRRLPNTQRDAEIFYLTHLISNSSRVLFALMASPKATAPSFENPLYAKFKDFRVQFVYKIM